MCFFAKCIFLKHTKIFVLDLRSDYLTEYRWFNWLRISFHASCFFKNEIYWTWRPEVFKITKILSLQVKAENYQWLLYFSPVKTPFFEPKNLDSSHNHHHSLESAYFPNFLIHFDFLIQKFDNKRFSRSNFSFIIRHVKNLWDLTKEAPFIIFWLCFIF